MSIKIKSRTSDTGNICRCRLWQSKPSFLIQFAHWVVYHRRHLPYASKTISEKSIVHSALFRTSGNRMTVCHGQNISFFHRNFNYNITGLVFTCFLLERFMAVYVTLGDKNFWIKHRCPTIAISINWHRFLFHLAKNVSIVQIWQNLEWFCCMARSWKERKYCRFSWFWWQEWINCGCARCSFFLYLVSGIADIQFGASLLRAVLRQNQIWRTVITGMRGCLYYRLRWQSASIARYLFGALTVFPPSMVATPTQTLQLREVCTVRYCIYARCPSQSGTRI